MFKAMARSWPTRTRTLAPKRDRGWFAKSWNRVDRGMVYWQSISLLIRHYCDRYCNFFGKASQNAIQSAQQTVFYLYRPESIQGQLGDEPKIPECKWNTQMRHNFFCSECRTEFYCYNHEEECRWRYLEFFEVKINRSNRMLQGFDCAKTVEYFVLLWQARIYLQQKLPTKIPGVRLL